MPKLGIFKRSTLIRFPVYALNFTPPMEGLDAERFATFRLGRKWMKRVRCGEGVLLLDGKSMRIFDERIVSSMEVGPLKQMALAHGTWSHNQLVRGEKRKSTRVAAARLMENMRKRYGPHIATDNRLCTVIYLVRAK